MLSCALCPQNLCEFPRPYHNFSSGTHHGQPQADSFQILQRIEALEQCQFEPTESPIQCVDVYCGIFLIPQPQEPFDCDASDLSA